MLQSLWLRDLAILNSKCHVQGSQACGRQVAAFRQRRSRREGPALFGIHLQIQRRALPDNTVPRLQKQRKAAWGDLWLVRQACLKLWSNFQHAQSPTQASGILIYINMHWQHLATVVIRSASSETAESYMLDLDSADSKLVSVCPRQFGIHYEVDHCNGALSHWPKAEEPWKEEIQPVPHFHTISCHLFDLGFLYILTDKDGAKSHGSSITVDTPVGAIFPGIQSCVAHRWRPSQAKVCIGKTFGCLRSMPWT